MDVIKVLNELLEKGLEIISVKRIRDIKDVKTSDRSKINFYWRTLRMLCRKGFIKKSKFQFGNTYRYEIEKPIKLEDVLKKAKGFFMPVQTKLDKYKQDRERQFQSYYDWELSFKQRPVSNH